MLSLISSASLPFLLLFCDRASARNAVATIDIAGISGTLVVSSNKEVIVYLEIPESSHEFLPGGSSCLDGGLEYHVHSFWAHGENTSALSTDCGSSFTGGHYDPYKACGPSTGNSYCVENDGCIDTDYNCDFDTDPLSCEIGDWSSKYGNLMPMENTTYAAWNQHYWEIAGDLLQDMAVVFHCGNGSRAFCAKFELESDVLPSTTEIDMMTTEDMMTTDEGVEMSSTDVDVDMNSTDDVEFSTEEPFTTEDLIETTEESFTTEEAETTEEAATTTSGPFEPTIGEETFDVDDDVIDSDDMMNVTQDFDYDVTALFEDMILGSIVMKPTGEYSVELIVPSSVGSVCEQLRYSIYETWSDTENYQLSGDACYSVIGNGVWDPTFSCMPDSADTEHCVNGTLCDDPNYSYNCDYENDPFSCSPSDLSGRWGALNVSTEEDFFLLEGFDWYLYPMDQLLDKALVIECESSGEIFACARIHETGTIDTNGTTEPPIPTEPPVELVPCPSYRSPVDIVIVVEMSCMEFDDTDDSNLKAFLKHVAMQLWDSYYVRLAVVAAGCLGQNYLELDGHHSMSLPLLEAAIDELELHFNGSCDADCAGGLNLAYEILDEQSCSNNNQEIIYLNFCECYDSESCCSIMARWANKMEINLHAVNIGTDEGNTTTCFDYFNNFASWSVDDLDDLVGNSLNTVLNELTYKICDFKAADSCSSGSCY